VSEEIKKKKEVLAFIKDYSYGPSLTIFKTEETKGQKKTEGERKVAGWFWEKKGALRGPLLASIEVKGGSVKENGEFL